MFIDIEIIFNNTYGFTQFTYKVPPNYKHKVAVGDIVEVPFRNGVRTAIVLKDHSENTHAQKIKSIIRKIGHIDRLQLKYLEQLAISNNINIGMLLHKYVSHLNLSKQQILDKHRFSINKNSDLHLRLKKFKNVIFVSSLLEAKDIAKRLTQMGKKVDFYQKTGGADEFNRYWDSVKNFQNIIILSVNFEKITIDNTLNFHFYNTNSYSYNLPTLNNINIIESSLMKFKIFKGNFFYYSEFPSLEFFDKVNNYFIDIPTVEFKYIYGNNLQDCLQVFDRKFNDKKLEIYSMNPDIQTISPKHKIKYEMSIDNYDTVIMFNPTISHNGILSSNRLINFIKKIKYFDDRDIQIIVFSTKKIDLNKQLTSEKINKWAEKEKKERAKYGPNMNIKVFKIISSEEIDITEYSEYLIGPRFVNEEFQYEMKIQINKKYNYNEIMSIYSIFKKANFDRVRSL